MSNSVCQSEANFVLAAILNGGKRFLPVLSPYKLVKSKCRVCEVPNGVLECKVVSHHSPSHLLNLD